MGFSRVGRSGLKLRMALTGPSGAGKTKTGLKMARALLGPGVDFAVLDTERERTALYRNEPDIGDFQTADQMPDFSPESYIKVIGDAERAGFPLLLIDSGSHEWFGAGGVLDIVDAEAKRIRGNSFMAWKEGTPRHQAFIDAIMQSKIHIIATFRSKQEYVQTERDGKKVV